ncbi:MAG: VanW family protein [Christensenellales bacterium]
MKTNKVLNILVTITTVILIVLLIVLFAQAIDTNTTKNQAFKQNVVIGGVNVKGLTKVQAINKINSALDDKIDNLKITLTYKDKSWTYDSQDLTVSSDIHTIVDDAYRYSELKSNAKNNIATISSQGYNYDIAFNHIFVDFKDKVNEIKSEIEVEPVNSEVEFLPNTKQIFNITKCHSGTKLDEDKLYADIEQQFKTSSEIFVELKTNEIEPEICESFYDDKLSLLGEFSTDLSTSKGGRKHNVDLALSKFNGKVVAPNQEVSFNEVTGPQTAETGYQSAIVIVNGQYVEGVGGGICQASTTLYNALLLSGTEIDEVHKHTLPVGYVELSLDAMVNEGTADMRFKNISDQPIYIQAYVEGDRAYAKVYGKPLENGISFKRSVEYVRTIPHNGDKIIPDTNGEYSDKVSYKGEYFRLSYPKEGYEAKGYLEKYINGEFVSKEMVRHEIYEPKQGILIEGTKEPEENEQPESQTKVIPPQMEVETSCDMPRCSSGYEL